MKRWTDSDWRASALAWARQELLRLRYSADEPDQFHVRPWSTVFRIPTSDGNVYLKAVPTRLAHEVRLTQWLADRFPDRVLSVLAADAERGLMLLPEGGRRLRDVGTDLRGWERLVGEYAQLQLLVAPHAPELLALGVPDRRLASLPNALAAMLPAPERAITRYATLCSELAAVGLPETIQMDDLHDGNVFMDGDRLRVFDWGDASVAHPFVSLGMILATVAQGWQLPRDDAAVERVRDAYLEPYRDFASPATLRSAAALAERVAPTVRILAWQLAHEGAPPEDQAGQWGETLEELIDQQRSALGERPR